MLSNFVNFPAKKTYISQLGELGLQSPENFYYLNQSKCYTVDGTNDAEEWQDTLKAMNTMGISPQEQKEVFKLLAGILYLGNIYFESDAKDQAQINDQNSKFFPAIFFTYPCWEINLEYFCERQILMFFLALAFFGYLFGVDVDSARKALCYRTISTGTQGRSARVSTYACPQNAEGVSYIISLIINIMIT